MFSSMKAVLELARNEQFLSLNNTLLESCRQTVPNAFLVAVVSGPFCCN